MAAVPNQVLMPANFQELFTVWNRFPDAVPLAGGAGLIRYQQKHLPVLPGNIISLDNVNELKKIARTERYLDIGAMVRLNEIISLGKIVPRIFTMTLEGMAGLHVRNIATIGGNLCDRYNRLDCAAPLAALDAHFELRSAASARWISATRFLTPCPPALLPQELLTRVRIPLEHWDYSRYRKFNTPGSNKSGNVIVLLMKNEKNILTDIRTAYSGAGLWQNRESRKILVGKNLPLAQKEVKLFFDDWKKYLKNQEAVSERTNPGYLSSAGELINAQIMGFIEDTILNFTDF